ncbi:MAG: hypothetical protein Q8R98_09685 [Rubrivivax sp.]|nr:hypothetical protein [Rubrivivax sp.]MDP3612111.1 hypothetical protein [Rubrivivax sp.]
MSLATRKYFALRDIDDAAGEARLRYITDVPGQQAVYLVKLQEAQAYLVAHTADPLTAVAGPHIAAQATRTAKSALVVAQEVVDTGGLWLGTMSPAIEAERMAGKEAVADAQTSEELESVLAAAMSALQAL